MLWIKSTWQRGLQSIEAKNQGAKTWSKFNFKGRANRDMKILLLFTPTKDIQVSFYDITKTIYPALLSSPFFWALLGITVSSDHVGLNLLCDVAEGESGVAGTTLLGVSGVCWRVARGSWLPGQQKHCSPVNHANPSLPHLHLVLWGICWSAMIVVRKKVSLDHP